MSSVFSNFFASFRLFSHNRFVFKYFLASFGRLLFVPLCFQ